MANFFKKSSKTLLLLSCTSILSSLVNAPMTVTAEEADNTTIHTEEITEEKRENIVLQSFATDLDPESLNVKLFERKSNEEELVGKTQVDSEVTITINDQSEQTIKSNSDGLFKLDPIVLEEFDQIHIVVTDLEGILIEKVVFSVTESPVDEEVESPIEDEETETPQEDSDNESGDEENTEENENILEEEPELDSESELEPDPEPEEEKEENDFSESAQQKSPEPELAETADSTDKNEPTHNIAMASAVPTEEKGTVYYYFKSDDTLYSLAERFSNYSATVESLIEWNNITDPSDISPGTIISVNGVNNYDNYNQDNITFTSNKQFLDYAGKYAEEVAAEYGLYASVMMAQTSLETGYGKSDLSEFANNFFGIKASGNYPGYSIIMPTWEVIDGKTVQSDAAFRFYSSYYESFVDNAKKLKNGLTNSPNFYNGTWLENTNSFKDATLFLTQRYATDPSYYYKLNNIILSNNLTRFDAKDYVDNSYNAIVTQRNFDIGNLPLDHYNAHGNVEVIDDSNKYFGDFLRVTHVTKNRNYANIYLNNNELGWIHTDALNRINYELVNVDFSAYVSEKNTSVYSLPAGQEGSTEIGTTGDYMNQKVQVTTQTADGLHSYLTKDGKGIGWVRTKDLAHTVNPYNVIISDSERKSIDTLPWGTSGYAKVASASEYTGQELQVVAQSQNGSYALIQLNGEILGWIDTKALSNFNYVQKNQKSYITSDDYSVDSLPWGTAGYQRTGSTEDLLGTFVTVTKEKGSYWFATSNGQDLGWIDKKAFGLDGESYQTVVGYGNYSIDTLPWGTPGYERVASAAEYLNQPVEVAGSTQNDKYLLIRKNGKDIGWIDYKALLPEDVNITTYEVFVGNTGYTIDSLPWGTPGYERIGTSADVLGRKVTVIAESKSGSYALITDDNQSIGWVDKKAFGLAEQDNSVMVINGNYSIDSLPWGTPGYEKVASTLDYLNQNVDVIGSVKQGAYFLISQNGEEIGWVDHRALSQLETVNINYSTYVGGKGYSIDTLPWGTPGYQMVGSTSDILGKVVDVTAESQNRKYAFVSVDGTNLGWIDKKALGLSQSQNSGMITQTNYSIDTLPWGTDGYQKVSSTENYLNEFVQVLGTTHNGSYLLVHHNGSTLGWVDANAVQELNTVSINYSTQILKGNYSIDSLPWGTQGYKKLGQASDYLGEEVKVIAESSNRSYALITINGETIGWVDKKALA